MVRQSKAVILLVIAVSHLPASSGCKEKDEGIQLISNGTSYHHIVLQPGASPSEQHAAEVLREHVLASTGVDLPVLPDGSEYDGPMILLGRGPIAQSLGVDPGDDLLGDQGFVIRTVDPHVIIAGTSQAGTLYGVYRFLEDHLGVRWYAPGVTHIPSLENVTIEPIDRTERPAFMWRHTSWEWPGGDEDFLSRMGVNNGSGGPDYPYGRQYSHDSRAHSYFRFISPGEFFDTHPEYFSEIGGERIRDEAQLCLTNPDVLDIVTERMLQRMAENPDVHQHNFSQMDYYNYCQCPQCRAINEQYGTTGATQFLFVNQLAERTSAVYPEKLIGTLAYTYTEDPPQGMEMHPNVAVWLCHMFPSCDSHPVETCPLNADYRERALAWSQIVSHLYIWHYNTNFVHYYTPFPNLRAMSADMRFYRDIGVEGIYLQGMGHSGGGGEFSLLRPYYGMKLMWNPDLDPDTVLTDFLMGYYKDAWRPIWDYITLLHDKVTDEDIHMHLYTNPGQGYLTDDVMEAGKELFDEAEQAAAADPEILDRVQVARMPLMYARIFPRNGYTITNNRITWVDDLASFEEVTDFIDRMEDHGFITLREASGDTETLMLLYMILASKPIMETIENPQLTVDVVPMLAGRALRITHRQTGECVTAYNVIKSLYFPLGGGLEDRVGEISSYFGWAEPASVEERTETSITTTATTFNGFELRRTLTLDPTDPVIHVQSTLTNPGDSAKDARLRSHLELMLGDVAQTRVRFTSLSGESIDQDMTDVIAGLREGVHFYDQDAPAGTWTFSGTKGLELIQRFDSAALDFAWIYAYPETLGEVEVELWAPRVVLNPGESITFTQELEIRPVQ